MVRLVGAWFQFQSALPLRGATIYDRSDFSYIDISIRAPLAGSDVVFRRADVFGIYFNPRSPCGERPNIAIGFQR